MAIGLIGFILMGIVGMILSYVAYFCFVLIAWAYKKSYE
jgi:uncharacterized membrane protein YbaN (DUF454 family)